MGNRTGRSTDIAIRLVTEAVYTAWKEGAVASLPQLDIQGAFDMVSYRWLIHTLEQMGCPCWICNWVASFLTDRIVRLHIGGKESREF